MNYACVIMTAITGSAFPATAGERLVHEKTNWMIVVVVQLVVHLFERQVPMQQAVRLAERVRLWVAMIAVIALSYTNPGVIEPFMTCIASGPPIRRAEGKRMALIATPGILLCINLALLLSIFSSLFISTAGFRILNF